MPIFIAVIVFIIISTAFFVGFYLGERLGVKNGKWVEKMCVFYRIHESAIDANNLCLLMAHNINSVEHYSDCYHAAVKIMDLYEKAIEGEDEPI